ncbi:hypothetical protein B484DRAFT_261354, partial [Ochromonadaceae sp. CCMP2298]
MLLIIRLLVVEDPDTSQSLGVRFVHHLALLNQTAPALYADGLALALRTVEQELPVLTVYIGDQYVLYEGRVGSLRASEMTVLAMRSGGLLTEMVFDAKARSVEEAVKSMYSTCTILVLLVAGVYFFTSNVNRVVIRPIERLVDLVTRMSEDPLGYHYKTMGVKEGFVDGMETTVLLRTITKIGALMKVGFGEAGASVIAKNLAASSGGRLNLMGPGEMIHSIFGFCDVRQFTDTTECLQEEVMLFVNRIAHILHS